MSVVPKKTITLSVGAKRNVNDGNVFCALVMSYEGSRLYQHRFTDILTRDIAGGETSVNGGFAYMIAKALSLLTETCRVRVYTSSDTRELTRSLALYSGARVNPEKVYHNTNIYPALIRMINARVDGGDITIGCNTNDVLVNESLTMATAFYEQWESDVAARASAPKSISTPSPL